MLRRAGGILLLLAAVPPVTAGAATIRLDTTLAGADFDAILDGFPGLAPLDGAGDLPGNALAVSLKDGVTEERAILELPLAPLTTAGVDATAIASAVLHFNVDDVLTTFGPGTDFDGTAAERINAALYAGDGLVDLDDFARGTPAGSVTTGPQGSISDGSVRSSGPIDFEIDVTAGVKQLLAANATHAGIVLSTDDSPTGTSIDDRGDGGTGAPGTGGATMPFLLITTVEATPPPAPTATPAPTVVPTATPSPAPTMSATPAVTPSPGPTVTAAPTVTAGPGGTPTPTTPGSPTPTGSGATPTPGPTTGAPTPTPAPTTGATPTPAPSSGGSPTPAATRTPGATPSPGSATPTPGATTPTPTPAATPSSTPVRGVTPTPRPVLTPSPRPTTSPGSPSPSPTAPRTAPLVAPRPDATGDQLVLLYDARDGFTTFLNLHNLGAGAVDVLVTLRDAALAAPFEQRLTIAAGEARTIDVGLLRAAGLPPRSGAAFVTVVADGGAVASGATLGGSFTIANLGTGSAWGAGAAARRALVVLADGAAPAPVGAAIDGDEVRLRAIRPGSVELAAYYDPATLEPAELGGNQLVLLSFDDAPNGVPVASTTTWRIDARRGDGTPIAATTLANSGVTTTHLVALLGEAAAGASGSVRFGAEDGATNRLVFFAESLGTFATGYLLPAVEP